MRRNYFSRERDSLFELVACLNPDLDLDLDLDPGPH